MAVTLITGAASGIGTAVADRLQRRGDSLVLVDRDTGALNARAASGDRCAVLEVDVTDEAGMREAIAGGRFDAWETEFRRVRDRGDVPPL